jgi:hypothetical protein
MGLVEYGLRVGMRAFDRELVRRCLGPALSWPHIELFSNGHAGGGARATRHREAMAWKGYW